MSAARWQIPVALIAAAGAAWLALREDAPPAADPPASAIATPAPAAPTAESLQAAAVRVREALAAKIAALPVCIGAASDVAVSVVPGAFRVTNCSLEDVCWFATEGRRNLVAWIPACLPANNLPPGETLEISTAKVDPAEHDAVRFNWWHKGKHYEGTEIPGPDRVRVEIVDVLPGATPALAEPPAPLTSAGTPPHADTELAGEVWAREEGLVRADECPSTPARFAAGCRRRVVADR